MDNKLQRYDLIGDTISYDANGSYVLLEDVEAELATLHDAMKRVPDEDAERDSILLNDIIAVCHETIGGTFAPELSGDGRWDEKLRAALTRIRNEYETSVALATQLLVLPARDAALEDAAKVVDARNSKNAEFPDFEGGYQSACEDIAAAIRAMKGATKRTSTRPASNSTPPTAKTCAN